MDSGGEAQGTAFRSHRLRKQYADLRVQKTFICATLASTLIGTFTAGMGLYDKIEDKRERHKQKARDTKQDSEIKELRESFEKVRQEAEGRQKEIDRLKNGGGGRDNDVASNFERNAAMVQRMYDEGYGRLGTRFAQGDSTYIVQHDMVSSEKEMLTQSAAITENQLQAQIIALQQTVISVLQDALANDRQLTRTDMSKLIAASNSAREGSLDALRQAQYRLSSGSVRSTSPPHSIAPSRSLALEAPADQLFCRYSLDLQHTPNKPLAASFAPGGSCQCPACGVRLDVTASDFWIIGKRMPLSNSHFEETREFRLGQRFALKCHTPDGEYACVICSRGRDVDAICRTVEALVKHVGGYHEVDELEREVDLRELVVETRRGSVMDVRRASMPALSLRAPSPPREWKEEVHVREYR